MEVEQESKAKKYIKLNVEGEIILLDEALLPYFRTLTLMIGDNGGLEGIDEIPVSGPVITPTLVKMIISFYTVYEKLKTLPVSDIVSTMRDIIAEKVVYSDEAFQTFAREWVFLMNDEHDMIALATAADFLVTSELVIFVVDHIYDEIGSLSAANLERRYKSIKKRKEMPEDSADISMTNISKRLKPRLQYAREEKIQAILSDMLPYTLVRGIDPRIRQYPALLIGNEEMTFIGREPPHLFPHYVSNNFAKFGSISAIHKGEKELKIDNVSEVSCGKIFFTILEENGKLSVYGESNERKGDTVSQTMFSFNPGVKGETIEEKPMGDEVCLAVWSSDNLIIVLTNTTVYAYGQWFFAPTNPSGRRHVSTRQMNPIQQIVAWDLLDVACGPSATFFLTRKGLYGSGSNLYGLLGIGEENNIFKPVLIDVDRQEIVKVWTGTYHSLALSTKNTLYACGLSGSKRFSVFIPLIKFSWTKVTLPVDLPRITIIAGNDNSSAIVAENKIYLFDDTTSTFVEEPFDDKGTIKDILFKEFDLLVYTTTGVYVILYYYNMTRTLEALGGSDSKSSPFRLNIEVEPEEEDDETNQSNKKPRLGCQVCRATALYANASKTGFFCSLYCLHKQEIK